MKSKKKIIRKVLIICGGIIFVIGVTLVIKPQKIQILKRINFLNLISNKVYKQKNTIKLLKEQYINIRVLRKIIKKTDLRVKPYIFNSELVNTSKKIPLSMRTMTLDKLLNEHFEKKKINISWSTFLLSLTYTFFYQYITNLELLGTSLKLEKYKSFQAIRPMTLGKLKEKKIQIFKTTIKNMVYLPFTREIELLDSFILLPYACPITFLSDQKIQYNYPLSFLVNIDNFNKKQFDLPDYSVLNNSKLIEKLFQGEYRI